LQQRLVESEQVDSSGGRKADATIFAYRSTQFGGISNDYRLDSLARPN